MKEFKIFRCQLCGNVVVKLADSGVNVFCCGQPMTQIKPNTQDAATEKHVPVVEINNKTVFVKVGEIAHPMLAEHYISHIILLTSGGVQIRELAPNMLPQAEFAVQDDEKVIKAYSLCNLHGLWSN